MIYSFYLSGPNLTCNFNFQTELKNTKFKQAFVEFLIDYWGTDESARYLKDKEIYLSYKKCYKYTQIDSRTEMNVIADYKCNHEEADTKFVFFINKIRAPGNYVVRCCDTDI